MSAPSSVVFRAEGLLHAIRRREVLDDALGLAHSCAGGRASRRLYGKAGAGCHRDRAHGRKRAVGAQSGRGRRAFVTGGLEYLLGPVDPMYDRGQLHGSGSAKSPGHPRR